jgi:hypothetical protein
MTVNHSSPPSPEPAHIVKCTRARGPGNTRGRYALVQIACPRGSRPASPPVKFSDNHVVKSRMVNTLRSTSLRTPATDQA